MITDVSILAFTSFFTSFSFRGNFAVVKRCKHKENGGEYAAKCITKKRSKASKRGMSKEAVEIEAGVLMALEHEAIIKLYDVFETRTNMTLVMEL